MHRDIKPENFLFETDAEDSDIKVIDFGLSKCCNQRNKGVLERCKTMAGTRSYISPEVFVGNYDKSCDLWSAGCVLYTCLCGYPPFYGDDDEEVKRNITKGKFDMEDEVW